MHGSNKDGFTIMEAILALVILVLSLTPIMLLQLNGVRATSRYTRLFERMQYATMMMHNLLLQSPQEKQERKSEERRINRPKTTVIITQEKPSKDSILNVFQSLTCIRATMHWREDNQEHTDVIVTYRYRPVHEGTE